MIYVEAVTPRDLMEGAVFIGEVPGATKAFDRGNVNRSVNEIALRVSVATITGSLSREFDRMRMAFGVQKQALGRMLSHKTNRD